MKGCYENDQDIAFKFIHRGLKKLVDNECEILKKLNHENIVVFKGFFEFT